MNTDKRLAWSLLTLRLSIFLVMLMWTADKFMRPEHLAAIFEHFYFYPGLAATTAYVLGAVELMVLFAFVLGLFRRYTYGAVLVFHALSTFSSYNQYLNPFEKVNLLFFAAWPMLAACLALYLLRDHDHFTLDGSKHS